MLVHTNTMVGPVISKCKQKEKQQEDSTNFDLKF